MSDDLGDRMKQYEAAATGQRLDPALPICARIDGRAFSTFTRRCDKPFDARVSDAMRKTAAYLVEQTHAKIGYVQSDEITLILHNADGGSVFFDGRVQKLTSVLASMAGVKFFSSFGGERLPAFDCRVWQVSSKVEAANVLLWRALDCRKNSIQSVAQAHFSAKKLHGQGQADILTMLADIGVNFEENYPHADRHGVFFRRVAGQRELDEETWLKIPEAHRPENRWVTRSWVSEIELPYFKLIRNRPDVVFDAAEPLTAA